MAVITAMATMAISAGAVLATAPGNDIRQSPAHISTLGTVLTGNTAEATSAGEPVPSCGLNVGKTVWFRFRAPIALIVNANTGSSDFDTVLQIYVSTSTGLKRVDCNDDAFGPSSPAQLMFNAAAGKVYYFQLGGYNGASGNYNFYLAGGPRNDAFANAAVAKTLPFSYQEDTTETSGQGGETAGCGIKAHSVWFKYKRSTNASVVADTFGSQFDTVINLYRGTSLASLSPLGCSDDWGGTLQSQIGWTALGGTTYYIQVTGSDITEFGPLTFTITRL
jgi:hypothetical protein